MNFITYIPLVKPEGQTQGFILRWSRMFNPLGDDSPVRLWEILPLLMEYIAHVITALWCGEVGICDVRVYTVYV